MTGSPDGNPARAQKQEAHEEVFVVGQASRHAEKPQGPLSAILAADRAGAHLGCFASSIFHHHLVPSFSLFAVSCAHVSSTYARSSELEPGLPTGRSRPRALGTLAGELYLLASRCCAPTTIKIVSGRTPPGVLTPHPSPPHVSGLLWPSRSAWPGERDPVPVVSVVRDAAFLQLLHYPPRQPLKNSTAAKACIIRGGTLCCFPLHRVVLQEVKQL